MRKKISLKRKKGMKAEENFSLEAGNLLSIYTCVYIEVLIQGDRKVPPPKFYFYFFLSYCVHDEK